MVSDLISRSALKETMFQNEPVEQFHPVENREWCKHFQFIENAPAVDAVYRGVFEQVLWERNTAFEQLEEHGIPFGGTAPDVVNVVRCKDCKHCFFDLSGRDYHICMKQGFFSRNRVQKGDFCSYGERRVDDG